MHLKTLVAIVLVASWSQLCHGCKNKANLANKLKYDPYLYTVRLHVYTSHAYHKIDVRTDPPEQFLSTVCAKKPLLKLIVHGFSERWNMSVRWNWVEPMKNEMLKKTDLNPEAHSVCVIVVDWEELAKGGDLVANYWRAISNMRVAAEFMTSYFHRAGLDSDHKAKNMHCIGFSLGCHMCSILYKVYKEKYGVKPGRITGLDPAGPFFQSKPESEKLHFTDAHFVDIVHTSENFGLEQSHGHMDFYPDKGPSDITACSTNLSNRYDTYENVILYEEDESSSSSANHAEVIIDDKQIEEHGGLKNLTVTGALSSLNSFYKSLGRFFNQANPKRVFTKLHQFFGCSHLMSVRFFQFSINQCYFKSQACESYEHFLNGTCSRAQSIFEARMGYHADKSSDKIKFSHVSLFLPTTDKPPFCIDPVRP